MNEPLGQFIRRRRKANHMTQEQLSELAEVSARFISQLEKGKETVCFDVVSRVLAVFGCHLEAVARHGDGYQTPDNWTTDFSSVPSESGTYLIRDQEKGIYYVGSSADLHTRLAHHAHQKKGSEVAWILLEGDDVLYAECFFIYRHRPFLNQVSPRKVKKPSTSAKSALTQVAHSLGIVLHFVKSCAEHEEDY